MKYLVKTFLLFALVSALLVATRPAFASEDESDVVHRLNAAAADLNQLTSAPDKGIPQEVLESAKCVAIVPSLVKGGFIFGARFGRGVATCRTPNGWSAPAFFTVAGGSWGAQIGVEGVDLVMLFMNDEGARHLLSADFKLGVDASAAAGPVGRHASANTDWKMKAQILTYSRARGLFAGVTLNGASVHADNDAIRVFYGRHHNFRALLTGRVAPPQAAHHFLAQIRVNFHEAEASK